MTIEKIDLLTNIELLTFFKRSIRGCMTLTSKHRVRSGITTTDNKQYMIHLEYVDENNLYGLAMCQPLPRCEFCWVEYPSVFTREFVLGLDEEETQSTQWKLTSNTCHISTTEQQTYHLHQNPVKSHKICFLNS